MIFICFSFFLQSQLYKTVVDDVITNVKEAFLDEGVDEQVLQELRHLWENKLQASKALDPVSERPEGQMATPAMGILLQQQSQSQQLQQGYIPRGAVLTTTTQQPQQTTFPVSISANQAGELTGAAAAATMALPMGLFQQQLAALGAGQGGNVTLQPTGAGQGKNVTLQPTRKSLLCTELGAGQGKNVTLQPTRKSLLCTELGAGQGKNVTLQPTRNGQYIAVQNIGGRQTTIAIPQQAFTVQNQGTIQTPHVAGVNQAQDGILHHDDDGEEEEPLNSADDVSEEDPTELFDAENVVVCQYDKINRNKNKWKFHLKDGIMNLNGRDYVFQKANGDAEW
ncbi:hypothetical protein BaRGS_00029300 [Batillaria attramentaria]|uniref:Transcription initiation factor IIA subunit 1 n=1 Tax=Batillaria attramentaria TaxID=370345 RepID=A0ABD0JXL1_9CAEN